LQDNATIREYIRHPSDIPIQVTSDWTEYEFDENADQTLSNVSLGGLAFTTQYPLETTERVRICIPVLNKDNFLVGTVAWCEKSKNAYEVGVEFERSKEVFRLRMIEQICHIEHYRKEVARVEGRKLNAQESAEEWIEKYAGDFPAL
jgi:hypothetical protein